ncbi:molybdopterin-dependent oxidoreductase FAD-binding subunit [Morganella psychrotolerans]|uniref:molybdopterin-dependent oxidoreductase FAD-binding subunit n=1 Tax=Morganella psychrotolerans TaxID=368603 RepID=UPI0039AEE4D0
MIEQFFRPATLSQATELKNRFQDSAVWLAGGSKLNALLTKTSCNIAISLSLLPLKTIEWQDGILRIGATVTLEALRESPLIPRALYDALGFVYSRHIRNQATIGGEIATCQREHALLPVLLVLDAQVQLANSNDVISLESYLAKPDERLITHLVLQDPFRRCATRTVRETADGWAVVTAAVALTGNNEQRIAVDGVGCTIARLPQIEAKQLSGEALEKAVSQAINPKADLTGSEEYKRYITGILVSDLLTDCRQMGEK